MDPRRPGTVPRMTVLLATSRALDSGEPGAPALDAAFARLGLDATWVVWDDPEVDWGSAGLVAARSPWDYAARPAEFLAWADRLGDRLLNGPDVFAWNHDKSYLADLHDSGELPVVPTRLARTRQEFAAALAEYGVMVVKPRVGAGGAGLIVVDDADDPRLGRPVRSHPDYPVLEGPWICQPVVESVHTAGETSVFVLDGEVVSQFLKSTAGGDVRVNEEFGGRVDEVPVGDETAAVAQAAWRWAETRFDRALDYARVDLMRLGQDWVISELELIEPGLYLDVSPSNAAPFADLVAARLPPAPRGRHTFGGF